MIPARGDAVPNLLYSALAAVLLINIDLQPRPDNLADPASGQPTYRLLHEGGASECYYGKSCNVRINAFGPLGRFVGSHQDVQNPGGVDIRVRKHETIASPRALHDASVLKQCWHSFNIHRLSLHTHEHSPPRNECHKMWSRKQCIFLVQRSGICKINCVQCPAMD